MGTVLAPLLADAGHEPVLFDLRPLDTKYESVQGDILNPKDLHGVVKGAEIIIHLAAILGIQASTARDFYDINLTGTFNVWEAAAQHSVRGLVFSSTMSVYKPHDMPLHNDRVVRVTEQTPTTPFDLYGYTKAAGEEMCRVYGRIHGIPSVALRYGMFSPEPFFPYGIRLLYGGVDVHDVASCVAASVEALPTSRITWEAVNVESLVPFEEADAPQLLQDPLTVLDRHYPRAKDLLNERGVERLLPIHEYYAMEHARNLLGFQPECNFEQWLEDLRARPEQRATRNPPWP